MTRITVARASEAEQPACLALLPQASGLGAELLIARRDGAFVGAAAVAWRSWSSPVGFPIAVQVISDARRGGVGRALLAAADDLTRGETAGLWSGQPLDPDSDAAAFLQACGFALVRRQHYFEARLDTLLASIAPLAARMRARGRVPEDARLIPLADSPLDEVGWLVTEELGGGPFDALRTFRARTSPQAAALGDRSIVVMRGEHLAAAMVQRLEEDVLVVDARVVAPAARGDWPNVVLLEAAAQRALAEGAATFRFHCDDSVDDTLSLARRSAARETAVRGAYYRATAG
jgi:GNAT superfamily N-acetyltransferase